MVIGVNKVDGSDEMKTFGKMGGLFVRLFTPDSPPVFETLQYFGTQYAPSPNMFWRENNHRSIYTWGGTPLLVR